MTSKPSAAAESQQELLNRAAVLSVFDVEWIQPHLGDAEVDDLMTFLSSSCERVADSAGTPRWQLRDDERIRVLRDVPRASLQAAMDSVTARPGDPVQAALDHYLGGSFPPVDQLDAAELTGVLQLERWVGEGPGLPVSSEIRARLDWMALVQPLQRLVAHEFFGRQDLLAELRSFIERGPLPEPQPEVFLIEGVGGSGKSTVLARLILDLPAPDDHAVYISLDRGWLIDGGSWAIFDEIIRQAGAQLPGRRNEATELRQQVQDLAARASGYSDVASRSSKQREPIPQGRLRSLGALLADRGRLVVVLDTLEELARRDESMAYEVFGFLKKLPRLVPQVRIIAAGRALPNAALTSGRPWPLTGLSDPDSRQLLRALTGDINVGDELIGEVVRLLRGNPLSLHLAADVLKRTGEDPTQLVAVAEGNVQGQLYSRLLEHIRDPRVRAVAHPGLVVRRLTEPIIRDVLAEPCGIAPLDDEQAAAIFRALRDEATLCEPSPDDDGALVHRQDVRTLMLPSIQQDSPGTTRAIHEAAVRYYEAVSADPPTLARGTVARREELYHRLMLNQERPVLEQRWDPVVAGDLATAIDELPLRSQLYLSTKVHGLRLDPAARAAADDDEWQNAVRPAAMLRMERDQVTEALELVQERRGSDGRPLLPDLEIEALERLERLTEALSLVREERKRASRRGAVEQVRALLSQEARILERRRRWSEAWTLLDGLAALDRDRRARTAALDDEVRVRELVVLTSILRIARHERLWYRRIFGALTRLLSIVRHGGRAHRPIDEVTRETVELAEATPERLLTANPSLLRDLAGEIGRDSPKILQLAVSALATPASVAPPAAPEDVAAPAAPEDVAAPAPPETAAPPAPPADRDVAGSYPGATSAPASGTETPPEEAPAESAQAADAVAGRWSAQFSRASDVSQSYRRRRQLHLPALLTRLPRLFWRPSAEGQWESGWPVVRVAQLEEYPALANDLAVWHDRVEPQFRRLDHQAQILQNQFWRQYLALITGGLAATSLGAIQAALGGGVKALAVTETVLTGVLAGLIVLIRDRRAHHGYLTARLKAERIKSEFFLFLARVGSYAADDRATRLMEHIDEIAEDPK